MKKIIFVIPLLIGIGLGVVITSLKTGNKQSVIKPTDHSPVRTFGEQPTTNGQIDHYLITSKGLLDRAIALSKNNQRDEQVSERNQQIIQLINEALDTANTAISNSPGDHRAWAQRAKIYQTIASYMPEAKESAVNDWQEALKLAPANQEYQQSLAKLDPEAAKQALVLPDAPPVLEANTAQGPIIANPEEANPETQSQESASNALSGTATLPFGETEMVISNQNVSEESQIYLTQTEKSNLLLFVKSKAIGQFVVGLAQPAPEELEFEWRIIN
ncbi:MAG: hypothetical protein ABID04_00270 [Patescibacteria group bacterium]